MGPKNIMRLMTAFLVVMGLAALCAMAKPASAALNRVQTQASPAVALNLLTPQLAARQQAPPLSQPAQAVYPVQRGIPLTSTAALRKGMKLNPDIARWMVNSTGGGKVVYSQWSLCGAVTAAQRTELSREGYKNTALTGSGKLVNLSTLKGGKIVWACRKASTSVGGTKVKTSGRCRAVWRGRAKVTTCTSGGQKIVVRRVRRVPLGYDCFNPQRKGRAGHYKLVNEFTAWRTIVVSKGQKIVCPGGASARASATAKARGFGHGKTRAAAIKMARANAYVHVTVGVSCAAPPPVPTFTATASKHVQDASGHDLGGKYGNLAVPIQFSWNGGQFTTTIWANGQDYLVSSDGKVAYRWARGTVVKACINESPLSGMNLRLISAGCVTRTAGAADFRFDFTNQEIPPTPTPPPGKCTSCTPPPPPVTPVVHNCTIMPIEQKDGMSYNVTVATDLNGPNSTISWGDGASSPGLQASHTYTAAGNYTISASISYNDGGTATCSTVVTANPVAGQVPPPPPGNPGGGTTPPGGNPGPPAPPPPPGCDPNTDPYGCTGVEPGL